MTKTKCYACGEPIKGKWDSTIQLAIEMGELLLLQTIESSITKNFGISAREASIKNYTQAHGFACKKNTIQTGN